MKAKKTHKSEAIPFSFLYRIWLSDYIIRASEWSFGSMMRNFNVTGIIFLCIANEYWHSVN